MRISDWSSDVCSSDLERHGASLFETRGGPFKRTSGYGATCKGKRVYLHVFDQKLTTVKLPPLPAKIVTCRSEEHTSELQSLMRISYAVFCLKKKKKQ